VFDAGASAIASIQEMNRRIEEEKNWARDYKSGDGQTKIGATYEGTNQTRLDNSWSVSRGYVGGNSFRNRWRLTRLRDRSRELERNNPLACGLLDRVVENVVGTGMRVQARTSVPDFNKQVEELWAGWADKADYRQRFSFNQLQSLVYRSYLRDGDVGVALMNDGYYPKLWAVEGDWIDTFSGGYNPGSNLVDGIQFDPTGNFPVAFNVLAFDSNGFPKEGQFAARDFIFLPRDRRLHDVRGEPCFSQVLDLFDQIDGYREATVVAARIAACAAMLIKQNTAPTQYGNLPTTANSQGNQQKILTMEPGQVHYLNPGEEVSQFAPQHPQQVFSDFIRTLVRFVGLTVGLPLEILMLDFSKSNYSNARAALLQLQRAAKPQQDMFIRRFLSRVYQWRISLWVKDGSLKVPEAIRDTYWKHQWIPNGWAWVDPLKDLQAAALAVDYGFDTVGNMAMQRGHDFDELINARQRERERMTEAGLPEVRSSYTRDPMTPAGAEEVPPEEEPENSPDPAVEDDDQ
jgi:lambda family phage portal protein